MTKHVPVLLTELLDLLQPQPHQHYVDATLGGGSMAEAILNKTAPDGRVIGIEQDAGALSRSVKRLESFGSRFEGRHGNFKDIDILAHNSLPRIDGIYFDLGISSDQLADSARGISFQNPDAPLDMRMSQEDENFTAADLLMSASEDDLVAVFSRYGEEPKSKTIAREVVRYRKDKTFTTVQDLLNVIDAVYPRRFYRRHPGTKVFQSLRIAVNDELNVIEEALPKAFAMLSHEGRLAVISFHSLEDRIVKHYFKKLTADGLAENLTKKVITPSTKELLINPRSRSAKLRVIKKTKK